MLEPHLYRTGELLAKSQIPSWLIAQPHNLDHFERSGFPVRVSSIRELGQLLDTMQEGRFDGYMEELGGLTDQEYGQILAACRDMTLFQAGHFPNRDLVLPLSTLLSSFTLYRKMLGYDAGFRRVLEIGPGCGYLSFFLKQHRTLENYSQIEACESFYILQNFVNSYCFGAYFDERALPPLDAAGLDFFVNRTRKGLEFSPRVRLPERQPVCTHYPWWRIGELATRNLRFDIVTSNANLLEFNPPALDDYLTLLQETLNPGGIFLVQCPGYPANGTYDTLMAKLWEKGFALLAFLKELTPTSLNLSFRRPSALDFLKGDARGDVTFVVNNLLLIKSGHPLYERYRVKSNYSLGFCAQEALVHSVFFARPPERRMRKWQEFVEDTERLFHTSGALC